MNRIPGCICELDEETSEPVVENYAECPVHKPDAITPREAANELIKKFYALEPYEVMEPERRKTAYNKSKDAATIAANEILSVLGSFKNHKYGKVLIPHYEEVIKEIPNL